MISQRVKEERAKRKESMVHQAAEENRKKRKKKEEKKRVFSAVAFMSSLRRHLLLFPGWHNREKVLDGCCVWCGLQRWRAGER